MNLNLNARVTQLRDVDRVTRNRPGECDEAETFRERERETQFACATLWLEFFYCLAHIRSIEIPLQNLTAPRTGEVTSGVTSNRRPGVPGASFR